MTQQESQAQQKVTEKPGNLLRETREQQELTVDDIFKRIHLEPRIIQAIEADDYSNIPTATYARGYLRTYAKTLGIDGDYVVSLYNESNAMPPPEIIPEVKPPSQVSSSDKPVKAFTYLISLALVLLLLIWYQSNFIMDTEESEEQESEVSIESTTPDTINNTSTDFNVVIHPEGWQTPKSNESSTNTVPPVSVAPAPSVEEAVTSVPVEREPAVPETATTPEETTAPDILPVESGDNTETFITPGPDTIELTISEDSWIEIYDANEERVFMDLGKQGERFRVKGTAPFNLILGYSPGVAVKFNNESFDPEPYSNNGVAQFQLPPE